MTEKRTNLTFIGPVIVIITWLLSTQVFDVNPIYLPSLRDTLASLANFPKEQGYLDMGFTLYRSLASFALATAAGVPLGLLLGFYPQLYDIFEILIDFFRSVPSTAFFPLFLLLFGVDDLSKILLSSFVIFWVILVNTVHSTWNTPKLRVQVAKVFKLTQIQILKEVILFDALPQILTGLRTALSISLVIIIVAEMFVGTKFGMGRRIYESYTSYKTPDLFSEIILVGLAGYLLNKTFVFFQRKFIHWTGI